MSDNLIPFKPSAPARPPVAIHADPEDVVRDPNLTTSDKRTILASWISDARAVEDAPTLRRLDSGAIVEVDAVRRALARLDRARDAKLIPFTRKRGFMDKRLSRIGRPGDDDDDPPPAPAGIGVPFRPTFVAATGAALGDLTSSGFATRA